MATVENGDEHRSYPERALITQVLGKSAKTKIVAVLLKESHRDLSPSEIAEYAGVHRSTAYEPIEELEEWGIITQTREVGGSKLYKLNKDNEVAARLKQVEQALVKQISEKEE